MAADSDKELHAMAVKIGLKRAVFGSGRSHVYYIDSEARAKALTLGAILVERSAILKRLRR